MILEKSRSIEGEMTKNTILLSIQPKHVGKILAGKKKVELRRRRPRIQTGDYVIIYASFPVMAISGFFIVERVITGPPKELWPSVKHFACVTRKEFDRYYEGSRFGVAIYFSEVQTFNDPLKLSDIREFWPEFNPPQGYRYFSSLNYKITRLISSVI